MLHLKVLEIRNSIAHLQYSNDQLKPYAEGTATATASSDNNNSSVPPAEPDQDCIEAIRENEQVIERMAERIAIVRIEVEERGVSWNEFQSKEETEAAAAAAATATATNGTGEVNGEESQGSSSRSPWADGTFQTGVIRNGEVIMDAQAGGERVRGTGQGGAGTGAMQTAGDDEDEEEEGAGVHL